MKDRLGVATAAAPFSQVHCVDRELNWAWQYINAFSRSSRIDLEVRATRTGRPRSDVQMEWNDSWSAQLCPIRGPSATACALEAPAAQHSLGRGRRLRGGEVRGSGNRLGYLLQQRVPGPDAHSEDHRVLLSNIEWLANDGEGVPSRGDCEGDGTGDGSGNASDVWYECGDVRKRFRS